MANGITGAVYDPPLSSLPHVAIVFHNGEVLTARPVPNVAAGEALIAAVFKDFLDAKNRGEF